MTTIEINKPPGFYLIDKYAGVMFPSGCPSPGFPDTYTQAAVEALRREVVRAGKVAVARARDERRDLRASRERAMRLVAILDKVKPLLELDPADLAEGFRACDGKCDNRSAALTIIQLAAWVAELRTAFQVIPAAPSRSDPLGRHFVAAMRDTYVYWRHKQPPHGRTGPFVDLCAAGWRDLGFPGSPDGDLEGCLGRKIEHLFDEKIHRQKG